MSRTKSKVSRIILGLVGLAAIAYLSACSYIWVQQKQLIFRPAKSEKLRLNMIWHSKMYICKFIQIRVTSNACIAGGFRQTTRLTIKGIRPGDIIIYGHSLGGAVAINLAISHPEAKGLIIEATFTSIADMGRQSRLYRLLPLALITHQRFDSINKVNRLKVPVLYIHGTEDRKVPPEMSRELYNRTTSPKQLTLISGGGHNNSASVGGETYLQAVGSFVNSTRRSI